MDTGILERGGGQEFSHFQTDKQKKPGGSQGPEKAGP